MLEQIIGAVLQLLLFTLIPFVVYLISAKSIKGFWAYIGLKPSTTKANLLALGVMLITALPMLFLMITQADFQEIFRSPTSVTGELHARGPGLETMFLILFEAGIKTSLSEEILFRGFLAKRLISWTNFQLGNILQAVIFGAIHTLLFLNVTDNLLFLALIFLMPTTGAYFKVYLNEKLANGSIIPGWIAHASANIVAYSASVFFL